ncbi:MAG TPA: hypothetical protein VFG24_05435 [Nitrosopumilaceae archaeon]|nr:hypothetical protein [Nitrosopumilaceae archaeon]
MTALDQEHPCQDVLIYLQKYYKNLTSTLEPEEKEAVRYFRLGLRTMKFSEKCQYYKKAHEILGNILLK